ncbi:MAG TPA: AraC family transcriptional regulator [Opitutaceae bacterium]|nr:AraC family transcriptional regulator [Opitutaceae bacterium]
MRVSRPITVELSPEGVLFAESAHTAGFRMSDRTDPYHKVILVLEGAVAYREKGRDPVRVDAGSVVIVPAGTVHRMTDEKPATLFLLCIGRGFAASDKELEILWHALAKLPRRSVRVHRPGRHRLEAIWRRALAEKAHGRIGSGTATRALAEEALVLLARLPAEEGSAVATERVAAVMREVRESFYEPWDLDRAAGRAGLSRRRFTDLFREASGRTFQVFLSELRMEHAARLLRSGEHSVTGVIFSCGFTDVSHFYRTFRQRFGAAPGEWIRAGRK